MLNKLLFNDSTFFPDHASILNTRWGNQLLQLLQKGPQPVKEIRRKFSGSTREMLTTIGEFIQAGFASHRNGELALALPLITRTMQEEYRQRMQDSHLVLVQWIDDFISSSFYQERLIQLSKLLDYDLVDLNFLLISCFGMVWGGRSLFDALKPWEEEGIILLPDAPDLGLCQSMTSHTSRYTFSSFGYAEDVFRDTLGNLFRPGSIVSSFEPLVGKGVQKTMPPVMGLATTHILDKCGDLLLAVKNGEVAGESQETEVFLDLLGALKYLEGDRLLIPLFSTDHSFLLAEIIREFLQILCDWYLQEACSSFILRTAEKSMNPGVSWLLQIGQVNELLLQNSCVFLPQEKRYQSLVFAYPVDVAREICQQYSWLDLQKTGGGSG